MTRGRHPVTGRFLAYDCEIDCQDYCVGACGADVDDEVVIPPADLAAVLTGPVR